MSPTMPHRINRDRSHVADAPSQHETHRLMARYETGSMFEKPWLDGETVSFGAWVYAYGRREGDVRKRQAGVEPRARGA
jgi:hypothetical protein